MKRWPFAMVLLAACAADSSVCPSKTYLDAFELVLSSDTWARAQYRIEVSYTDSGDGGTADFRCDVAIPAVSALDGGTLAPDAAVDARGNFACTAQQPTALLAGGTAGQELVLDFQGTPATVHLIVRDADRLVLEQDLTLTYDQLRPDGDDCPGPRRAGARIELPP